MGAIRVLLVDDHKILREGLKSLLQSDPEISVVATADTAREGLLKAQGAAVDVALIDLSLPDEDGFWLLEQLKSHMANLPVIILSMHSDEETVVKVLSAGAAGYLTKSAEHHEVVAAIKAVHGGGSFVQPRVAHFLLKALRKPDVQALGVDVALSERDTEILKRVGAGQSNQQIAVELFVSLSTVKAQLRTLFQKLDVSTRTEVVLEAMRRGLIDPPTNSRASTQA